MPTPPPPNTLYYGDNLFMLRTYVPDSSVDLIYLDPPFNSDASYSLIFKERDGTASAAQLEAFEDSWHWDRAAAATLREGQESGPPPVRRMLTALFETIGPNDLMAYLVMMTPRLVELRRVLRPTGTIWLHCDPTASHYLKVLLDTIFGKEHFLSEVIWKRTSAHSSAKRPGPVHDVLLVYTKTAQYTWNPQYQPYDPDYIATFFDQVDPDGRRWKRADLTGAGVRHGATGQPWRGINVTAKGRHWAIPPSELDKLDAAGRVHWPQKAGGMPRLKQYLEDLPGVPIQDVWTDIPPMHNLSPERLGYPTQKPEQLLERIIALSSNPGDVVLDCFAGCGTAIVAAHSLGRHWIGIDITHLAITLLRGRLHAKFGMAPTTYRVFGEPVDLTTARALAAESEHDGRYQFQWWALSLVLADPEGGERKKGADRGIDGRISFVEPVNQLREVIVSVKSGKHPTVTWLRDLGHVVEREPRAVVGVLISLETPTSELRKEAATSGWYHSEWTGQDYPRLQILTIQELLDGRQVEMPPTGRSRAPRAARARPAPPAQAGFPLE